MSAKQYSVADIAEEFSHGYFVKAVDYDEAENRVKHLDKLIQDLVDPDNEISPIAVMVKKMHKAEQTLEDAHDFLCGCEEPGRTAYCVQAEAFAGMRV